MFEKIRVLTLIEVSRKLQLDRKMILRAVIRSDFIGQKRGKIWRLNKKDVENFWQERISHQITKKQ